MTTENKEELLRLYKLLWEQIKDIKQPFCLCDELTWFGEQDYVSSKEYRLLYASVKDNLPTADPEGFCFPFNEEGIYQRKSFVQRMITELENEIK